MPYKQHLDYFGGPEPYANAILQKEASGGPISDPAAAAAFRNAYPDLFQNTAQSIAGRQAYNVGVPASNIDPNYVQSMATGTMPVGGVPQGTASALPAGYAPRPYVAPQQPMPSFQDILAQLRGIAQPGLEARKGIVKEEAQTQMEEGYKNILDQLARQGILKSGQSFTRNEELLGRVNRDLAARLALLEGQTEEQIMQQAFARMSDLEKRGISAEQEAYNRWFQGEQTGMGLEQQAYDRRTAEEQEAYDRQLEADQLLREQQAAEAKAAIEEDERKWKRAEYLIKESPVVTNEVSLITGLPVGTATRWATEIIQKHLNELEIKKLEADAALQRTREDNAAAFGREQFKASQSSGGNLTPSGTYANYPGVTPAVEQEFGMSKEQIAENARSAGVTNAQYISGYQKIREWEDFLQEGFAGMLAGTLWTTIADITKSFEDYKPYAKAVGLDPDQYLNQAISEYNKTLHSLGKRGN